MRTSVVSSGSLWLIVVLESLGAAAADSEAPVQVKQLAERAFATADKGNKGYLDEKSLREARAHSPRRLEVGRAAQLPGRRSIGRRRDQSGLERRSR